MADVATLVIRTVTADVQRATSDLTRLQQQAGQTEQSTNRFTTSMGGSVRQLALMATGIGSVTAAVTTLGLVYKRAVGEAAQFEVQHATIQAVLRATGSASGKTAEQIEQLAESIGRTTLATSDSVTEAAQQLLTFRSIAGETFDRTLVAAQDLAAVGFGSVQSAAVQLGKALEDPEQGLSALRRVGVSFSESQRDLIKTLVDTGRTLEAQQVILRAVEQQVGGAGAAQASGLTGATHRLSEAWENLLTNIGNTGPWQAAANYLTGMVNDINTALNPSLESATAHLAELKRQKEAATFMGVDITFGELDAAIATTQETIQQLTVLNRAKEQQGQFAAESAAQIQLETAAEQQHTAELQRKGTALGELAGQLEEEKVQRDRLSAQATAAAEQRAAEAQQRSAAVRDIQIEAAQQQRLAAAWREGADAAREVALAIEVENAVRRIGIDIKSAEGQAVAQSIRLSAESQTKIDAETAAIARRNAEMSKMLSGPVGQLSTEDIRRDPSQSRQSQQQAEETAASWQVATQAAGVHFRTVDDFGVEVGESIGELTTSIVLYGESFEDVGKSILRSLIETTAQILITTAAVTAMRAAFSGVALVGGGTAGGAGAGPAAPGMQGLAGFLGFGVLGAGAGPAAGVAATGGATALTQVGAGSVTALPAGGAQGGLVGTMLGPQASAQAASQMTSGAGAGGSMGMMGLILGPLAAGGIAAALANAAGANTGGTAGAGVGAAGGALAGGLMYGPWGMLAGGLLGGLVGGGFGQLLGGQHGFDVRIPGAGGSDRTLFAAMVQPGERITATPPSREAAGGPVNISYAPSIDARGADPQAVIKLMQHERAARQEFERQISTRFSRDPRYRHASRIG